MIEKQTTAEIRSNYKMLQNPPNKQWVSLDSLNRLLYSSHGSDAQLIINLGKALKQEQVET